MLRVSIPAAAKATSLAAYAEREGTSNAVKDHV